MISIQNTISLNERETFSNSENSSDNASKKRKWHFEEDYMKKKERDSEAKATEPMLDIDLHLQTPLPIDWQRCLDLQSGQIHFYNTRTHKRTCKDPRGGSPEALSRRNMSLDLELNLPCDSFQDSEQKPEESPHDSSSPTMNGKLTRSLSWISLEAEAEHQQQQQQEMVAAVCMRCHMLVMLCKSSPACPNCKFMHPQTKTLLPKLDSDSNLLR